jgi:ubiquinone/menaquinone biosynthesis C-methylase UbiE
LKTRYALLTGMAVSFATAMLMWRFAARHRALPCPSWLPMLLENPYMNWMAGAETSLDRIELEPGMKLLDIGCGLGRLAIPAARRVGPTGTVVALDIQPGMLSRARHKVEAAGLTNVQFVLAGAGDGTLQVNTFDRALLVTVLGEIPDRKRALDEIFRALRPGGVLSVTEVLPDPHYQRLSTVRQLGDEIGFEEQRCFRNALAFTINLVKPDQPSPKVTTESGRHVAHRLVRYA